MKPPGRLPAQADACSGLTGRCSAVMRTGRRSKNALLRFLALHRHRQAHEPGLDKFEVAQALRPFKGDPGKRTFDVGCWMECKTGRQGPFLLDSWEGVSHKKAGERAFMRVAARFVLRDAPKNAPRSQIGSYAKTASMNRTRVPRRQPATEPDVHGPYAQT